MIDDRTPLLNLPLPHADNYQDEDVLRLRSAFGALDTAVASKADLVGGKVPAGQLPAYVDDVIEFANFAALPSPGVGGIIYVTTDTTPVRQWRWSGSAYAEIAPAYQLPSATPTALGGIKVGSGLVVSPDGLLSTAGGGAGSGIPVFNELSITPSSVGQTTFTPAGGYVAGQIEVYLNGVLQYGNGDDYSATNGTTIVLSSGVSSVSDTILLRRWIYLPDAQAVNKAGDTMTGALNYAPQATVASAATCNIGLAASNRVFVTGTTSITSLGSVAAGVVRSVTFSGALTLAHNATSLILPGGANITTSSGDVAEFESLGSGNWRCTCYQRADGLPAVLPTSDLPIFIVNANTTAQYGVHYVFLVGAVTLTLPSPGTAGNTGKRIKITNGSNTTTPIVDFGAGKLRQQSPGAMTLSDVNAKFEITDTGNSTIGWA